MDEKKLFSVEIDLTGDTTIGPYTVEAFSAGEIARWAQKNDKRFLVFQHTEGAVSLNLDHVDAIRVVGA